MAVSEYGEYPNQAYYVTPKALNWRFQKWIKQADFSEEVPTAIFEASYEKNGELVYQQIIVNLQGIQQQNGITLD